ncbi:RagB/SusD family nutrient uptake outer membrane protein [Viscerimonas tarda]
MKKIKIVLLLVLASVMFPACDDYLSLFPDNAQTSDQYWNSKSDVESVVAAGYVKLRESVDYLYAWGEARGTDIDYTGNVTTSELDAAREIKELRVRESNKLTQWACMYKVINMANSVLKYAPEVVDIDPSFTVSEMNGYFAEAYFQRSLAYFYLVRTFKDVPLVTQPYVSDENTFDVARSTEEEILTRIKEDLTAVLKSNTAKEFYPESDVYNQVNTKGRATKWSILALLADIYLWEGDYDKCISACEQIIGSGRVGMISKDLWFTNFFPGNSNESIFEIQYNYTKGQTNKFFDWFSVNWYYSPSSFASYLLNNTQLAGDVRGNGGTFYVDGGKTKIWKFVGVNSVANGGVAAVRASNEYDQNFIIYRLAEIYLMRAEAYTMKGNDYYDEAMADIQFVRTRAGIVEPQLPPFSSEIEMLTFIYEERIREFCGEGKSWFDLLRIARRNNYEYKSWMINEILVTLSPMDWGTAGAKLLNEGSHYLPVNLDEMQSNHLLEQNSYYTNLYGNKN